uniref:Probable JmjC domain-containing histone demethylation protein 2C n=1 Tax=Pundamilia nyererei TaxID=303518 RepID=A0A3B4GRP4_9CICH
MSIYHTSSKNSLSKPPPLIKHQPEGGEGLAGKITEQLSQQVTLVQPQHQLHAGVDRIDRRSPAISPPSSTLSSSSSASNQHHHHHHLQQQQQLRAMPSLHRAPVFHPPTQHALERKEAAERERAAHGGRLSPPTLTPIQPVTGSKTSAEQQKPPTLLPELRDIKGHGTAAAITFVASATPGEMAAPSADGCKGRDLIEERGGVCSGDKGFSKNKPQSAMASVIVRSSIKYDSPVGAKKSGALIHKELPQGRFYTSKFQDECPREPAAGRVIQPNLNLEGYKKTPVPGVSGPVGAGATNSVCRTAILVSSAFGSQSKTRSATPEPVYSARCDFAALKPGTGGRVLCHIRPETEKELQEGFGSHASPGVSLNPASVAGAPRPSPSLTPTPSSISGSSQPYASSFIHLKKHKAALAAAQSRSNLSTPPSSVTDWRKVKKLKQTGESFLQDDSCSEIGPNLQKCRECRVVRSKKGEEPAHSPVFCRFYYFRRLSYSKNGVIRMDGFSTPDQFDDEALSLWVPGPMEQSHLDQSTAKYILSFIGDKFCQMVATENTASTKLAWKRAVRGVREMCDACEATLFNIHWVCQKCGFVVCLDCYKAKERKIFFSNMRVYVTFLSTCVKGQAHDHKHLMPTQIIPGSVLTDLVTSMHALREKHNISSHCPCASKQNLLTKLPATNGVSQVPHPLPVSDILTHCQDFLKRCINNNHPDIPHCWLNNRRLLWLRDHRNQNNWKLFRECWKLGQPVLVSGIHKRLNASLWKADSFNQEFADHQGDLLNCKDQVLSNSGIKEFWDGFEDITKRPKSKDGEPMVYRLMDWPSGEEFMALMPSRYDDLMKNLPLPEYSDPEGNLNLASHLPSFFVRPDLGPRLCCAYGKRTASQDQDFGTAKLHVEVSDVVSVLVYVGIAKGNGVLSKTGKDLDEGVRKRLKDSSETPGALWHIYLNRDMDKVRDFLHKLSKEQGLDVSLDQDSIRKHAWYLSRKQRQRLLDEHGVQGWTVVQFLGDSVLIPAGAMHQVQNLHSCVQVINDFVSPEHVANSFHLTQELRPNNEEVNYEDKLQVKNILYHCVKEAASSLRKSGSEKDDEEHNS